MTLETKGSKVPYTNSTSTPKLNCNRVCSIMTCFFFRVRGHFVIGAPNIPNWPCTLRGQSCSIHVNTPEFQIFSSCCPVVSRVPIACFTFTRMSKCIPVTIYLSYSGPLSPKLRPVLLHGRSVLFRSQVIFVTSAPNDPQWTWTLRS